MPSAKSSGVQDRPAHPPHHAAPVAVTRHPPAARPTSAPWSPDQFPVPPAPGQTRFQDLNLPVEILHAVADLKFSYCTPVQALVLPPALQGKNATGRAQTGTGKTAAFLIAIFTRWLRKPLTGERRLGMPRALILAPTRELVIQIHKDALDLGKYCRFNCLAVFGGMDYKKQQDQLAARPVDLIVATPGRLLDFRQKNLVNLSRVEIMVIDEADRMLDMGFIPDVKRIIYSCPPKHQRQTMLFSATLTQDVLRLSSSWMVQPVIVEVEPEKVTVDAIVQRIYTVAGQHKAALLMNLLKHKKAERVLVFRNRRDGVDRLAEKLQRYGFPCAALSGDVPQQKRLRILEDFRAGRTKIVVATDVAGRGIHVDAISHVVNYDVPLEAEDYVHRIGRTGRAGATGQAVTFACEDGAFSLPAIEKYIGRSLTCQQPDESWLVLPPLPPGAPPAPEARSYHPRPFRPGGQSRSRGRYGSRRGRPRG